MTDTGRILVTNEPQKCNLFPVNLSVITYFKYKHNLLTISIYFVASSKTNISKISLTLSYTYTLMSSGNEFNARAHGTMTTI